MTGSKTAARISLLFTLAVLILLAGGCSPAAPTATADQPAATETPADLPGSSATLTPAAASETPIPPTPSPSATISDTPVPPEDATQTALALAAISAAETQFSLLEQATLTPCGDPSCYTPTPSRTPWMRPSRTPSPTPRVPAAELYLWNPGPLSKVISPIKLDAYAHTGAGGLIQVELLGEDGRLIYRQVLRYGTMQGAVVPLQLDVPFEISAVAETGRMVVSIEDGYKRPIAVTAVDVILQSLGSNDLTPSGDGLQAIAIQQPRNNQIFEGGKLLIKGMARASSSQPVIVELITSEGAVIASRQIALETRADGTHAPFEIELPYSVTRMTDVRIIARQQGDRLEGMVALTSVQVWLKP